jgi:hypothetical protein
VREPKEGDLYECVASVDVQSAASSWRCVRSEPGDVVVVVRVQPEGEVGAVWLRSVTVLTWWGQRDLSLTDFKRRAGKELILVGEADGAG